MFLAFKYFVDYSWHKGDIFIKLANIYVLNYSMNLHTGLPVNETTKSLFHMCNVDSYNGKLGHFVR